MTTVTRDRPAAVTRTRRPAVVEHVDFPPSTSDGRAINTRSGIAPNRGLGSQFVRFAAVGVVSTLAWAGLYTLLRRAGLGSVVANGFALVVTTIGNTAANRRLTFGVTGRDRLARDHGAGLIALGLALGLTTAAATVLERAAPGASWSVELAVIALANLGATFVRFAVLRSSVGRASPLRPV